MKKSTSLSRLKLMTLLLSFFGLTSFSYTFAECTTNQNNAIIDSWFGVVENSAGDPVDVGIYAAENQFFEAAGTASNPNPKTNTDLTYRLTLSLSKKAAKTFNNVFLGLLTDLDVPSSTIQMIGSYNKLFINLALQYALAMNLNNTGQTTQGDQSVLANNLVIAANSLARALTQINPAYASNSQFSNLLYTLAIQLTNLAQSYRLTYLGPPSTLYSEVQTTVDSITTLITGAACSL